MATNRNLRYVIGIDADVTEFEKSMKKAFESLLKVSNYEGLDASLNRSARAAKELERELKKAFNLETGKLDLNILLRNLELSGKSLKYYADQMSDVEFEGATAFTHVALAILQAELPLKRTNKLMDSLWVTMKNTMRWLITTSVLQTFTGAFEQALRYSLDLDESLNNIRIVTSKSTEDMANFAKYANETAKRLSTTTTDYTDASLIYYQQGLTDEEVLGRTETTIKLANAAGESARTASELMTAIWNNFYDGSKSLDYYADVMVKLGATTASSTEEIATGIEKFAAIGDTVGLSYEYAAAALATVTALTRLSADVVGTAFRTLFARLQDLELGETLDDGVTLGKYSKALETVGIDIIDANGNLMEMDRILDELGDKWETLTLAEKTSLALTVAGTRLYALLIALMDSWDFFQLNLATARGAGGALDEQTAIYAESWEAARDRVQAAAENIYDSLINPQFFIDLDDSITPFLDGIATVVDAMGGMNGLLATSFVLVNKVFGDRIIKNLEDIGYNFGIITKQEAARARLLLVEAATQVLNKEFLSVLSDRDADKLLNAEAYNQAVADLIPIYDSLDAKSQQALDNALLKFADLQEAIVETERRIKALEKVEQQEANEWATNLKEKALSYNMRSIVKDVGGKSNEDIIADLYKEADSLQALIDLANRFKEMKAQNDITNFRSKKSKDALRDFASQEGLDVADKSASKLSQHFKTLESNASKAEVRLKQVKDLIKTAVDSLPDGSTKENLQATREELESMLDAYGKQGEAIKDVQSILNDRTKSWAEHLMSASSTIAELSIAILGIRSIGDIFQNQDMDNGERFIAIASSLTMILPILAKAMLKVNLVIGIDIDLQKKEFVATNKSTISKTAASVANRIFALSEREVATAAQLSNMALASKLLLLGGILAIVGLVAGGIYLLVKAYNLDADAAKEAAEHNEKLASSYETLKNEYDSLKQSIEDYLDAKLALDKLSVGAEGYAEALEKANGQAEKLLELEPELQARARRNTTTGEIEFEGLEAYLAQKELQVVNSGIVSRDAAIRAAEALIQSERTNLRRSIGQADEYGYGTISDVDLDRLINIVLKNGTIIEDDLEDFPDITESLKEAILEHAEDIKDLSGSIDLLANTASFSGQESVRQAASDNANYQKLSEPEKAYYDRAISNYLATEPLYIEVISKGYEDLTTELLAKLYATNVGGYSTDTIKISSSGSEATFYDENEQAIKFSKDDMVEALALAEAYNKITDENSKISLTMMDGIQLLYQYGELFGEGLGNFVLNRENSGIDFNTYSLETLEALKQSLEKEALAGFELSAAIFREDGFSNVDSYTLELLSLLNTAIGNYDQGSYWDSYWKGLEQSALLNLPKIYDSMNTLMAGEELDEELIKYLELLEKEYTKLGEIRDRTSNEYIASLRDIQEGYETDNIKAAIHEAELLSEGFGDTSKSAEELSDLLNKIMDADYKVTVAMEADINSDLQELLLHANALLTAGAKIGEGFIVGYEDIESVVDAFPGILAGYQTLADGTIKLDKEVAASAILSSKDQLAADLEAVILKMLAQYDYHTRRAEALRYTATLIDKYTSGELKTEEEKAKQRSAIEQAFGSFLSVELLNQELLYSEVTTNEIGYVNEVGIAIQDAYGQSAINVASAYDSMVLNSEDWATQTIGYVNAVGTALSQVSSGKTVDVNIAGAGAISSKYVGGYTHLVNRGTSDHEKLDEHNFLDYLDKGDYAGARDWLTTLAKLEEEAALIWAIKIAEIRGRVNAAYASIGNAGKGKGSGSSGQADEMGTLDDKDSKELIERYHEINREIEHLSDLLDDLDNEASRAWGRDKLEAYSKQMAALTKQQENYNEKLKEARGEDGKGGYLAQDKANLEALFTESGIELTFKDNGELEDYKGVLEKLVSDYNEGFIKDYSTFVEEYNALSKEELDARKDERDMWEGLKTQYDDIFDERVKALELYEETIDTIQEVEDNLQETAREIADLRLSQIEHKLEVVLTVKDMRDAVTEFSKELAESFNDALTHGEAAAAIDRALMESNVSIIDDYKQQWASLQDELANVTDPVDKERIIGDIEELQGKVIGTALELLQWVESLEELLPNAIDAARERFQLFTDLLEHNETVLDTIKELYALQGITYKTMDGYNKLVLVGEEKIEAQVVQARLQRIRFENAREQLLEAERALDDVDETDLQYDYLKANRDALLAEYNEAQEAMLQSGLAAMETALAMYLDAVEKAAYDFGQAITNGMGLDLLQDKYDHYIEEEERYLDKVNEAYEVASWYDKLQLDIDNATNSKYKDRLRALLEEIDVRREGNTLSQYDLDILEAKYKVLQAQMALEDALNNKNQLRLVRDRQGNWNYQYTADADLIASAELNLIDAENEWYNIAKDQVKDVTGLIVSTWLECNDAIKEIYSDMTLTDEERSARAAEIYRYYTELVKFLEAEKQVSISDMTEAGNKSLIDNAILTGDTISDITGVTSEDIKNIIDETGTSVLDLLLADNETIKEIVGSNTELVDLFDNVFAENLENMTNNTLSFEEAFTEAKNNMENSFIEYGQTIDSIAGDTGTSLDNLKDHIDYVAESTDNCRELGEAAAISMWDLLDSIHDLSRGYADLANSVYDYIDALLSMSGDMASEVGSASKLDYDENFNYDAALVYGKAHGYLSSSEIALLEAQRAEKLANDPNAAAWGTGAYVNVQKGDKVSPWIENMFDSKEDFLRQLMALGIQVSSFDTGGYTGDFSDSKLAFLHQKELVLNEQDTLNMLAAVMVLRSMIPNIEKMLDTSASAGSTLMALRIGVTSAPVMELGTLEQLVRIEHVEFPNVTSSDEIQNAFASLVNDAAQWAKRRTS